MNCPNCKTLIFEGEKTIYPCSKHQYYEPVGIKFIDKVSGKEMILVDDDQPKFSGWLFHKHPDGQWVSLRLATVMDRAAIAEITENIMPELTEFEKFHPRAAKLMRKKKNFLVIAEDEPYFMFAYNIIKGHEMAKDTWTEEDERNFQLLGDITSAKESPNAPQIIRRPERRPLPLPAHRQTPQHRPGLRNHHPRRCTLRTRRHDQTGISRRTHHPLQLEGHQSTYPYSHSQAPDPLPGPSRYRHARPPLIP